MIILILISCVRNGFEIGVVLLISILHVSADHHSKEKSGESQLVVGNQKGHHLKKNGKKSVHDHEKAKKGKSEVVLHKKEDVEKGGKKHHALDEANYKKDHHKEGHAEHGAAFKQGDHQKKRRIEKGYREQYHKDEHKKTDTWFSNRHKGGDWETFGTKNLKHHGAKHQKNANGKYENIKHADKYGKALKFANDKSKLEHKGHQVQHGGESHYNKHEEYAKKKARKH